jgi:hypothetical protein
MDVPEILYPFFTGTVVSRFTPLKKISSIGCERPFHFVQLAAHNFELAISRFGLSAGVNRQGKGQASDCSRSSGRDDAIVAIKASYEPLQWTINKPLSVLGCLLVFAVGYFSFAWGCGAVLLWRNPLGLLSGGIAMLLDIACIGHGLWHLVH